MPGDIRIKTDLRDFEKGMKLLPREFRGATVTSLNKTGTSVKAVMRTSIRSVYNIKAGRINQALKISKAWAGKLSVEIRSSGEPPGLQNYGPKAIGVNRGHRFGGPGVSVMVKKGERRIVQGAFMVGEGQGRLIFERVGGFRTATKGFSKGKRREDLERLHGPSVASMGRHSRVERAIRRKAEEMMIKNMNNQMTRRLAKHF